jgi:uncharacterized protein
MLMLVSPAKKLDAESAVSVKGITQPRFLVQSQQLVDGLAGMAPHELSALMHISDNLGQLNHDRYQAWQTPFTEVNAKPAVHTFQGDVYVGLQAQSFSEADSAFAQKHLRILSGLYGVLRPLDLMQAYRLEMGTKFNNPKGADLYAFWGEQITDSINADLAESGSKTLVNLASNEYFKAVKKPLLKGELITPQFKDKKNGTYKIISFYAKKARGLMAAYAIKNRVTSAELLKQFDTDGYCYNADMSSPNEWVFTREGTE